MDSRARKTAPAATASINADNNGKNIRRQYIQPAGRFQVPRKPGYFLSVVVPAYNEEDRLPNLGDLG